MQKIFNKREKWLLYITITVVIGSAAFNFLAAPLLGKNDALNKEITGNKAKLKKYMRLLSQKEYIQSKYSKLISGLNLSNEGQNRLVGIMSELENLANLAGIRIIDLRPESDRNIDLYKEIRIDLRTEGAIEDYFKFIYDIENSLSLLRIKRFQLNAKPNTSLLEGTFFISQDLS